MVRFAIAALGLLLWAASPCSAEELPTSLRALIDARVDERMAEDRSPGLSLAIVADGQTVYRRDYGVADLKTGKPVPHDATYQIASVTKTFVGTLAAKLVTEGTVDLDVPVQTYLPTLRFHPDIPADEVTLRRLLSHRSGLPSNPANRENLQLEGLPDGFDPTVAKPYSIAQLYRGLEETPPRHIPGTRYYYSNLGMTVAAHALARADGHADFATAVTARLLEPLGMRDTFVRSSANRDGSMPTPYAFANDKYHKVFPYGTIAYYPIPPWTFGTAVGGAGLSSTADDLGRYLAAISLASPDSVITPEMTRLMFSKQGEFVDKQELVVSIGLGWRSVSFGDYGRVHQHSGHNDGHHAAILLSDATDLGVVTLTNGSYRVNRLLGAEVMLMLLQNRND